MPTLVQTMQAARPICDFRPGVSSARQPGLCVCAITRCLCAFSQVAYVSKGAGAKSIGGASTATSNGKYGPLAIGTLSSTVLYSLKVTRAGTYIASHAKSGATASQFTTAFNVPAGVTDLDVF